MKILKCFCVTKIGIIVKLIKPETALLSEVKVVTTPIDNLSTLQNVTDQPRKGDRNNTGCEPLEISTILDDKRKIIIQL